MLRIRIQDEHFGSYFRELGNIFLVKIPKIFDADPDRDPGIFLSLDPEIRMEKILIRDNYTGPVTLLSMYRCSVKPLVIVINLLLG